MSSLDFIFKLKNDRHERGEYDKIGLIQKNQLNSW